MIRYNGVYRLVKINESDETTVLYVGRTQDRPDAQVVIVPNGDWRDLPPALHMAAYDEMDEMELRVRVEAYGNLRGFQLRPCSG